MRLKILLTLEFIKNNGIVVNLSKERKLEYFSKYESNDNKPFWVNCKPYFRNKHSKANTDISLVKMENYFLKSRKLRILLMIILDPLLTTLACITGMIIPCHRR